MTATGSPESAAAAALPEIRLRNVCKTYRRGAVPVPALHGIDMEVAPGEFTAIMGPSGSGKSTLLHILGLVDTEYEGSYQLGGRQVSGFSSDQLSSLRNSEIGFVFQAFHLLPQLTVLENAALPALYARDRPAEVCRDQARARIEEMGLGDRLLHRPHELSMGQRQRVAIGRALVNEPRLLLADEPTGALDSKTADEILGIFTELHRRGSTIVLVTHNREVAEAAERVIHVRDGQIHDGMA
jgi:putative ABC transport system ATP-binding protein